jgi:hypothetical protein
MTYWAEPSHEEQPDPHINNDGTITFTFRFTTEPGLVRGGS